MFTNGVSHTCTCLTCDLNHFSVLKTSQAFSPRTSAFVMCVRAREREVIAWFLVFPWVPIMVGLWPRGLTNADETKTVCAAGVVSHYSQRFLHIQQLSRYLLSLFIIKNLSWLCEWCLWRQESGVVFLEHCCTVDVNENNTSYVCWWVSRDFSGSLLSVIFSLYDTSHMRMYTRGRCLMIYTKQYSLNEAIVWTDDIDDMYLFDFYFLSVLNNDSWSAHDMKVRNAMLSRYSRRTVHALACFIMSSDWSLHMSNCLLVSRHKSLQFNSATALLSLSASFWYQHE